MRVLLVDDEALALDRLRTFFDNIDGVEVVGQAQDGDEALAEIARLTPDLVILDVQMPGKSGLRAAAELAVEPRPELVFVTAHEHRSEEHTSELQSLMRISYAVFCLKKKTTKKNRTNK